MVVIRLARRGAKKRPFYNIVVTDSRKRRDSGFIERVGHFNPVAVGGEKPLHVDKQRVDYWIKQGVKLSKRAAHLIKRFDKERAASA